MFKVFTDFGICFTTNMLSSSMIFNSDVIHDDFKKIKTLFINESEPLWTSEKGYLNEYLKFPHRANQNFSVPLRPMLNEIDKENTCGVKAFLVFVHKPNEVLTPFHDRIFLRFDELMEIKVTPQGRRTDYDLKKFSPDLRRCYFEGERKLKFFKTYTKALCKWECHANATLEKCGCVKLSMPRDNLTKICSIDDLECATSISLTNCQCYDSCFDVTYTAQTTKTAYNRKYFYAEVPES